MSATKRFEGLDIPLHPSTNAPRVQLSCNYDHSCTERQALDAAHKALKTWNQKSKSNKGRTYELLEITGCKRSTIPYIIHCNFIARPYRGSESEHKLFFAEIMYVMNDRYNYKAGGDYRCTACCILGPRGTKSGDVGCKMCCMYPDLIQHPENGDFMKGSTDFIERQCVEEEKHAISNRGSRLQKEATKCARIALASWNVKNKSQQGPKYELVEALGCRRIVRPTIYHCNFLARPKNGSDLDNILFFAELKYSKEFDKVVALNCHLCCILGPAGTATGIMGCEFCFWDPIRIHHPENEDFIKEWRGSMSKFMPKKQSETRLRLCNRDRHILKQSLDPFL